MANPTSNFGWQMPTPTDLVTDLPADFEVFGQAVDTSLADLKGGTSGQVLSKNSNTDMDFVWVTTDDANAIQNSIVNAKGDLIGASANDTPAILSVGNNGETLVADSSTATGLRYTAGNPISNPVLNSAMQIWQRGTSFTSTGYTADRWDASIPANFTFTRQLTNDTTNLPNIQYCMRLARNSGATTVGYPQITNSFETINSIPFVGKTVTLSYYARRGANWSAANNEIYALVQSGTGTDQSLRSGYTGNVTVGQSVANLTTTWTRYSVTGTVPTNSTELGVQIFGLTAGTAGANDYFEVTGVQVDVGSVALPFRTNQPTIATELTACQRYYWQQGGSLYQGLGPTGYSTSTTNANAYFVLPVEMRTVPTLTWANIIWRQANGTGVAPSAIVITGSGLSTNKVIRLEHTLSAVTAGLWGFQEVNGTLAGYLGLSAEL